ncbi:MAG: ABC transporter permease [Trueperaceae bacterium]|nr:ABC transporter permease [Trueperaceae bacterium]MCO5173412.1 ABC transporter permease [Trueperaceae bacterium]
MRRRHLTQRTFVIGFGLVAIVAVMALLAPWIAPHDPAAQSTKARLLPPVLLGGTLEHPLGTDPLGRDLLSRIIYGSRISILLGLASVLGAGTIGLILGAVAGYVGGKVDAVIMRLVDLQMAIPFLVLALAVLAALGPGLTNLLLVLVITGWVVYARVMRAQVMAVKSREYVAAARALGVPHLRVLLKHVLPAAIPPLTVISTVQVGTMILTEASLSFLGLGVPPSIPTWGSIAADGRAYMTTAWWVTTLPGLAIFLTVMGVNFLGDWLRDLLDPTLRQ